jgi:outer membrane protein OmpA-like peptidoglycan-associated protein/Tfp pilus assembly protein PilF
MKLFSPILLLFGVLLFSAVSFAQPKPEYTISERKAIKMYEEAIEYYQKRDIANTQKVLLETVNKFPQFAEVRFLLAQTYLDQNQAEQAIPHLEEGLKLHPEIFPEAYLILAEEKMSMSDYKSAEAAISKFIPYPKNDAKLEKRSQLILSSCIFAQRAMERPVPFDPINLGEGVNSEMDEYYPCITADQKTLLFTRLVNDDRTDVGKQEDFYISRKDAQGLFAPAQPVMSINTVMNEGAPSLSADGNTLIFTACQTLDGQWGENRTGVGSCDLFYSLKAGNDWGQPENMGNTINSGAWESQPSYGADGKTMYFVRGTRTARGMKDQDIYYSVLRDNGSWTKPEKVRGLVNTDFDEESVMIHPDGNTLYFSSNGHPGMGGMDIYLSRREVDGTWGKPVNLGYPINTSQDENSFQVTADGEYALFASDRAGGKGGLDLYQFALPESAKPKRVYYVEGVISDKLSYKKLDAQLELIDMESGQVVANTHSNPISGGYLLCLPPGKDYVLNVSKEGYLFSTERFTLSNEVQKAPKRVDVALQKIKVGTKISLTNTAENGVKNIFFDTNSDVLKKESFAELNQLIELLNKNPQRKIEVGGHTDDVGDDASNLSLSQRRAEAVKDYLVKNGVAESRVQAKGYGETQPQVPNDSDINRAKNRRTEFLVVE